MIIIVALWLLTWAIAAHASLCTLSWDATVDPAVAGYNVYTSTTSQAYGAPAKVLGLQTSCLCEDLGLTQDGLVHYFVVTAFTAQQESDHSNEASIALYAPAPPPPTCLKFNPHGKCIQLG